MDERKEKEGEAKRRKEKEGEGRTWHVRFNPLEIPKLFLFKAKT
jgi:hypothetical protein